MTPAIYRLALPDWSYRLAAGDTAGGPRRLLDESLSIGDLLAAGATALHDAAVGPGAELPPGWRIVAPIDEQEVWAAGVTYERSRDARVDESVSAGTVYDQVYDAQRPELFFKSVAWRVRGPKDDIGIRADSAWNVPEPELALFVASDLSIAGYSIANDVSSRSIEGENPLYLPQAKVYDGSCALGPCIVPAHDTAPPFEIRLTVLRDGATAASGATSTARLHRRMDELASYLGRALTLPTGAVLLTGTGIVPEDFTLTVGDVVRIEIDPIGALENTVAVVGGAS